MRTVRTFTIFAVLLYLIVSICLFACGFFDEIGTMSTIVTTVTAIIGAFAIWFQMKREKDIKEAEFIMSYNMSFLENEEMVKFEQQLEHFRKEYERLDPTDELQMKELKDRYSSLVNDDNLQIVINYLVYHEALAAMIKKGVLNFDSIDSLFAYRFFLVMNNPIVQEKELCPDYKYYKGCFWLYMEWCKYQQENGLYLLLGYFSLAKTKEYKIVNGV